MGILGEQSDKALEILWMYAGLFGGTDRKEEDVSSLGGSEAQTTTTLRATSITVETAAGERLASQIFKFGVSM